MIYFVTPTGNSTLTPGQMLSINVVVRRLDLALINELTLDLIDSSDNNVVWRHYVPSTNWNPATGATGEWKDSWAWTIPTDFKRGDYHLRAYSDAKYNSMGETGSILREATAHFKVANYTEMLF
ncbi:hypothetical protein K493DRAFT_301869 [Basidiobolus meristosporus CBS 931.73]|uniref:Macroglobulin domain-containing protein n=1 Tax=Basidiobolus meristosporus CBS 931.73 TaxID=1314790 RepID=A0A1Y1Y9T4_9FUNG|nr:hypothetical protein K493DRAFT_301869 [Basidiobolus meristosporus CBS 931.73]|eukprot:ORX94779.1 hypothetical protein K493DRAFT_301869 [Basidiobolus meristosporus CBS 931.73]